MRPTSSGDRVWTWLTSPVSVVAIVGLITGMLGIAATMYLAGTPIGGFAGAIGWGVTAGVLTDGAVSDSIVRTVLADLISSVAFFLLVLTAYLSFVGVTEGITVGSAVLFTVI